MTQRIDVSLDGLHQLLHRIERQELSAGDWAICGALVLQLITRTESKQQRRLAKLAAAAPNKLADVIDAECTATNDGGGISAALSPAEDAGAAPGTPADGEEVGSKKVKGHGRNGAGAYIKAKHFMHALMLGVLGALCEACGAGRMTRYREKVVVRVVGQPLFGAEVHHFEQARCRARGRIVRARGPDRLLEGLGTSYVVYDWSACAVLIVMHYFGGAPFKRLESLHQGWGVPMADANQWQLVDQSDNLLLPLYKAVERHGIQRAVSLRIDDTGSQVVSLMRQIQDEVAALKLLGESTQNVRTGINATGVYLQTERETVILFYTGRHHAGEVIDQLLVHRCPGGAKLVKVTDGASKNFDHRQKDNLVEATCNAHAFLKFRALKDKYPAEYALAGEVYNRVFDNDDEAKARGFSPEQRMQHHRQHSKPLMEKLRAMCVEKVEKKLVEPHSLLWEPLSFIINQWPRLTLFYEVPGVPLDTNLVEQTLIIPVRYLAGSFNYQTDTGAEVGDRHMSLVATARANGVEPVAYIAHCLEHHEDLAKRPEHYLPWVYRARLGQPAARPPTAPS
jgi:transposase